MDPRSSSLPFFLLLFSSTVLSAPLCLQGQSSGPPQITQQPTTQYAYDGGTAKFTGAGDGPPPLRPQWYKNGNALLNQTNLTLTLANVHLSSIGVYSVRIT